MQISIKQLLFYPRACFGSFHQLNFSIKNVNHRIAFNIIDGHFIKNVNGIFVGGLGARFNNHYKVFGVGALLFIDDHIPNSG